MERKFLEVMCLVPEKPLKAFQYFEGYNAMKMVVVHLDGVG